MAIYELTKDSFKPLLKTTYGENSFAERGDLQRLLRDNIEVVCPNTLVISEEFSDWDDSRRRIDLLGIDKDANLVVMELKRTEDGGHMELQAIRYAAMVANMTFKKAVEVYGVYLEKHQKGRRDEAKEKLHAFLDREETSDEPFGEDVRIVLISAEFSKELTTSVMWLNDRELDIRCIKMVPYQDADRVLVDVQQVLPLPEAMDYRVKIKEKDSEERKARSERHEIQRKFWTQLLAMARGKTALHSNISPSDYHYISQGSGIRGLSFNYTLRQDHSFVEIYIDRGDSAENKEAFDAFFANKNDIEASFGEELHWRRLDDKRASRIIHEIVPGGFRAEESNWPDIQQRMIDAMIRFEKALRPTLEKLKTKF